MKIVAITQGAIWEIDSFDQWDVERGKVQARQIIQEAVGGAKPSLARDGSTSDLIRRYHAQRRQD